MDGFVSGTILKRNPSEIKISPGLSFAEVPWLLRYDLSDPLVQAEIARQVAIPENEDGLQLLAEIEQNQNSLLKDF
ncbi:MAG: hypothetical protein QM523_01870 [Candidatus Pacebacteria bacterium]|nr:hypothetical protein [Candidatus Paceibacterota bacterium]